MIIKIVLVIIILVFLFILLTYNKLSKLRQKVKNSWSHIDVQLQRRFELVPNLVEAVKGYVKHESGTLEQVESLRSSWNTAKTVEQKSELDIELANALNTITVILEGYPELKANKAFLELQKELKITEDKIAYARQFYNDIVTIYNTKLQVFPNNIIAKWFYFSPATLFEIENEDARKNVDLDIK